MNLGELHMSWVPELYCLLLTSDLNPLQVLFVQVDTSEDSSDRITEFFGIEDDDIPTCRLINLAEDMKKFVPEFSGVGGEDVKEFVGSYLEGKLKVCRAISNSRT